MASWRRDYPAHATLGQLRSQGIVRVRSLVLGVYCVKHHLAGGVLQPSLIRGRP